MIGRLKLSVPVRRAREVGTYQKRPERDMADKTRPMKYGPERQDS